MYQALLAECPPAAIRRMLTPIRAIVAAHVRRSAVHGKVIGGDEVLVDEVAERDALLGPEPPAFRVWTAKFLECCPERCPGGCRPESGRVPRPAPRRGIGPGRPMLSLFCQTDQPSIAPCRRSLRRSSMASIRSSLRSRWTS
jgi:hypothetical protein